MEFSLFVDFLRFQKNTELDFRKQKKSRINSKKEKTEKAEKIRKIKKHAFANNV